MWPASPFCSPRLMTLLYYIILYIVCVCTTGAGYKCVYTRPRWTYNDPGVAEIFARKKPPLLRSSWRACARHTPTRRPALNENGGGGPCKTRGGRTPPAKRFIIDAQRVLRNIRNYRSGDDDGPRGSWAVARVCFEFFGARQKKRGRRYVCTLFYK